LINLRDIIEVVLSGPARVTVLADLNLFDLFPGAELMYVRYQLLHPLTHPLKEQWQRADDIRAHGGHRVIDV
jgi:hypothetical protein